MNRTDLENALLECIREVQELSGKECEELTLATCPFFDLDGFDSLTAIETTVILSKKIGKKIKCGRNDVNLFVSKDKSPLRLEQVLDRLEKLIQD